MFVNQTHNLKDLIKEVLEKGYLMSLAVQDDGGVWVSDVIYIHDEDLNIYWMSDPDVRHSKAIGRTSPVAASITISDRGENNLGLQFEGVAEKIAGARHDLATKHYLKRNKPIPNESDDVLEGDSWYVIHPRKIELINEKLFGFKKQKFEL
ncbi:MAG: hypothetical protein G01um101420_220 [Parcubacteria group bacterium Gr01-1014_20]|nr:MAG: hypothetical protein G01um101420_220 [Parcubacteria group bacterium Gr01-1014_20]